MEITNNANGLDPITEITCTHCTPNSETNIMGVNYSAFNLRTQLGNNIILFFENAEHLNSFLDKLCIAAQAESDRVDGVDVADLHKAAGPDLNDKRMYPDFGSNPV